MKITQVAKPSVQKTSRSSSSLISKNSLHLQGPTLNLHWGGTEWMKVDPLGWKIKQCGDPCDSLDLENDESDAEPGSSAKRESQTRPSSQGKRKNKNGDEDEGDAN